MHYEDVAFTLCRLKHRTSYFVYMVVDHGFACPDLWGMSADIGHVAKLISAALKAGDFYITDSKLPIDTDYLDVQKLSIAMHKFYHDWLDRKRKPQDEEIDMGVTTYRVQDIEQDGDYSCICTFCGKTAWRKPGAYAPVDWFFIDAHDDQESFEGNHTSTDGWIVYACSMECAASAWKKGPGSLNEPPEYPRFELEKQGPIPQPEGEDDE